MPATCCTGGKRGRHGSRPLRMRQRRGWRRHRCRWGTSCSRSARRSGERFNLPSGRFLLHFRLVEDSEQQICVRKQQLLAVFAAVQTCLLGPNCAAFRAAGRHPSPAHAAALGAPPFPTAQAAPLHACMPSRTNSCPLSALPPAHARRLRGRTVEEDTAEALAELPAEKQMRIAAGFRDFSERIA